MDRPTTGHCPVLKLDTVLSMNLQQQLKGCIRGDCLLNKHIYMPGHITITMRRKHSIFMGQGAYEDTVKSIIKHIGNGTDHQTCSISSHFRCIRFQIIHIAIMPRGEKQ